MSEPSDILMNGGNDIDTNDIDVNNVVEGNGDKISSASESGMDDNSEEQPMLSDGSDSPSKPQVTGEMSPAESEHNEELVQHNVVVDESVDTPEGLVEDGVDMPVDTPDEPIEGAVESVVQSAEESTGSEDEKIGGPDPADEKDGTIEPLAIPAPSALVEENQAATDLPLDIKDDEKDTDYEEKNKDKVNAEEEDEDDDDEDDKQGMVEDEMDLDNDVNEDDDELDDDDVKPVKKIKKEFGSKSKESSKSVQPEDPIEEQIAEPEPQIDEEKVKTYIQTHTIIVPSYSSWFNMKKIHPIEKKSLPEFFELNHPSKSPKVYVGYRNFMINAYRLNPNEYLTLTSCRRNLVGDVGTLMRVFKFLNKWGLVNYQVNPSFKPSFNLEKLNNGSTAPLPYAGEYKVNFDSPRGLFPFETFKLNSEVNIDKLKHLMSESLQPKLENKENFGYPNDVKMDKNSEDNKRKSEEETSSSKKQKDNWTTEELRKLLVGIKTYKNDWFKVSEEVKTKSPSECILKFLKLPIEDNFNGLSENELKLMKYSSNFPVNSVDNPVISNLIFMSQLVDSDVAKAASDRASNVMYEKILEKIEKLNEVEKKQESKEASKKPEEPKNEFDDMIIEPKDDDEEEDEEENKEQDKKDQEQVEILKNAVDEALEDYKVPETSSVDHLKSLNSTTFGIVGSRAHLFKTLEEREINKLTSTILNQQANKIDLKLQKISKLEEIYQTQQKILVKQQEEVFMDRLNLTNSTIKVTKKLEDIIKNLENNSDKSEKLVQELAEIKTMIYNPLSSSTLEVDQIATSTSVNNDNKADSPSANPLSYQSPQTFKVWVP